jgi:hypothetical protein
MDQQDGVEHTTFRNSGATPCVEQALYSRRYAARVLGNVHVSTIIRLERKGLLRPIRLNKHSQTGQVFYRVEEVMALLEGANDAT